MLRLLLLLLLLLALRVCAVPGAYGSECTPTTSAPPPDPTDANYRQKLGWFIRFADAFMYPNNTIEAAKINSTLFSENVQGRVDLTSTFDGRELNTEYIFGLFSTIATELNPAVFNILGVPTNYTITGFTVTGNQVIGSFIFSDIHQGGISLPIEAILFLQFNDAGEITQYDATLRRGDWFFDTLLTKLSPLLLHAVNFTGTPTKDTLTQILLLLSAQSVCAIHDQYCLGPNQQYPDHPSCLKFMTSIPFGQPYELGQNTSNCRNVHQNMVPLRPSVHCPHIGPSGGGACVPRDYVQVTTQKYFLNSYANPLAL